MEQIRVGHIPSTTNAFVNPGSIALEFPKVFVYSVLPNPAGPVTPTGERGRRDTV